MPPVARENDTVLSPNGFGFKCRFPGETSVGEVNSNNVYANGKLIVVLQNKIAPHSLGPCPVIDTGVLVAASSSVKIGGKGVGRIGDTYTNNDTISEGSQNVFVGG